MAVPAVGYPDQTRYAFAPGVACVTTPAGALLLNPPRSEKLTRLTQGQLQACQTLNLGPATVSALSAPADAAETRRLLEQLAAGGWLAITVCDSGTQWYSIQPFGQPVPPSEPPAATTAVLSKFAVLHRDAAGLLLEHPLAWCDLRIHDRRLLPLLDKPVATDSGVPTAVAARFVADLRRCGFVICTGQEDREFDSLCWSAPELWFHRRSTLGERTITWEHFGPTKWARDRFAQPPARRATYPGEPVALPVPDLAARRIQDPTLTAVLEDRVSTRTFDETHPVTVDQLAELLYRSARTRRTHSVCPGEELLSRPYPSGGGIYELELYPVVRNVAGLKPGMYHYDSFDHALRPVAGADSPAVGQLMAPASATLAGGLEPQLLLVMAARCPRMMWTYEQIGYATVLKDVGALMQTVYLAGTAMGLGVCALGFGDTAAFVAATGVDERQECSVGAIVVGSAAPA